MKNYIVLFVFTLSSLSASDEPRSWNFTKIISGFVATTFFISAGFNLKNSYWYKKKANEQARGILTQHKQTLKDQESIFSEDKCGTIQGSDEQSGLVAQNLMNLERKESVTLQKKIDEELTKKWISHSLVQEVGKHAEKRHDVVSARELVSSKIYDKKDYDDTIKEVKNRLHAAIGSGVIACIASGIYRVAS